MELERLGFDDWFHQRLLEAGRPDCRPARVTAVQRDSFLVRNESSEVFAELAGSFLFAATASSDLPCVGDWACVSYHNAGAFAVIHDLLPRKSLLSRKTPGRKIDYQPLASNLDVAFVVQSCDGNFNLRRLERYLAMINEAGIEPRLLLSKVDLVTPTELEGLIEAVGETRAGITLLPISNETGAGLVELHRMLQPGKTYCLLGSSGVGKTTIINGLIGTHPLETAPVRAYDGKGRHTTSRRQLLLLDQGAMLVDTPGMRELGSIGVEDGIADTFSDLTELSVRCRFVDCTHTQEPGCALLAAVEAGELDEDRLRSYLSLLAESSFHELSYIERRKKDRQFGKYLKAAMKRHRKK